VGEDYFYSCSVIDCQRPVSKDPHIVFNQPIGSMIGEVGVGEDNWLFLAGGSNNVLEMFLEDPAAQQEICSRWHKVVAKRASKLAEFGSRYVHLMVPEKLTVLGSKLPWPIERTRSRGSTFARTATPELQPHIIDLVRYFLSLQEPEKLFLKTDSHWNFHGAFTAYQLICAVLNFNIRSELLNRPSNSIDLLLDLGSKLPTKPKERATFYTVRRDAEIVSDEGLVAYKRRNKLENDGALHVGSYVEFKNENAPNPQKVIIFGDSFCEYRDHVLTALMAETFAHTVFVWSTSIDYSICERIRADFVFCLMTERFMARDPDDNFNVSEYTRKRLSALNA